MTAKKKSWKEKIDEIKEPQRKLTPKGMMYISTPAEIAEIIKKVKKGKLITTKIITDKLKEKHKVDFTCPLTTGIFVSIIANYCEDELGKGKKSVPPYWRVLKPNGSLYDKYLGRGLPQKQKLKEEGFQFESVKGKADKVKNYTDFLIK